MSVQILIGDVRERLKGLPDESVHCVVTSPPYWGLRDYGTAQWEGGDQACDHRESSPSRTAASIASSGLEGGKASIHLSHQFKRDCLRCGAIRVDLQLGLERTLGEHVSTMVEVFREVRRVLRKDGTLWLNYGDSYATSMNGRSAADTKAAGNDDRTFRDKPFSTIGPVYDPDGGSKGGGPRGDNKGNANGVPQGRIGGGFLKPKDLCGIPWRVAFALQDDGWWLRQDIIWSKPNPMPESIRDRCTKAHEYLFLLAKNERYFFDADAIKESAGADEGPGIGGWAAVGVHSSVSHNKVGAVAHGDQVKRRTRAVPPRHAGYESSDRSSLNDVGRGMLRNKRSVWEIATAPFSEAHFATFPPALIEPCIKAGCPAGGTVLDPFGGAGTTGLVADRLRRNAILIELNPEYAAMARKRIDNDGPLFAGTEHEPPYDANKDFAGSLEEGYRAIRERVAAGGEPWVPKIPGQI